MAAQAPGGKQAELSFAMAATDGGGGVETGAQRGAEPAPWLDAAGLCFNPNPTVNVLPLMAGQHCVVIDNVLANPQGLLDWAAAQRYTPPSYPYPGLVCDVPQALSASVADHFALHVRKHLGARRTLDLAVRLSLVTTPPAELAPVQWLCHRDRYEIQRPEILYAASVLYLFHDPALGGTRFYAPRQSIAQTEKLVADSQLLNAHDFTERYGWQPGYMAGSNAYFEMVAQVPAAWNRVIFYDGGLFHSAAVGDPARMSDHPERGRLTLNSFITCRKSAAAAH
jgi:hypothetical protein